MSRKNLLSQCDPRWTDDHGVRGVSFECPESDGGCGLRHAIPGDRWKIIGDDPSTVTIHPSIACSGACRMHISISSGRITFDSGSASGPDWSKRE